MPGRPKSKTKQRQIKVEINEQWYEHAVKVYKAGQETIGKDPIGYRAVCEQVEQECWEKTKKKIHLDKTTLQRRVKGGQSISAFNAEKSWLTGPKQGRGGLGGSSPSWGRLKNQFPDQRPRQATTRNWTMGKMRKKNSNPMRTMITMMMINR
jgi:hypothetical protein